MLTRGTEESAQSSPGYCGRLGAPPVLGQAGAVSFVVVWQHHVGAQTARSPTENKPSQNNPAEITAWLCPWNEPSTDPGQQEVAEREHPPGTAPTNPSRAPRAPRELLRAVGSALLPPNLPRNPSEVLVLLINKVKKERKIRKKISSSPGGFFPRYVSSSRYPAQ